MFLFTITEKFDLSFGIVLLPGLIDKRVPVGTEITIVRPDKTEIETKITGIIFGSNHISVEKSVLTNDIPVGSEVWANKSINHSLSHYSMLKKCISENDIQIYFRHKVDPLYSTILKLSGVIEFHDDLDESQGLKSLNIQPINTEKGELMNCFEVNILSNQWQNANLFKCIARGASYESERLDD